MDDAFQFHDITPFLMTGNNLQTLPQDTLAVYTRLRSQDDRIPAMRAAATAGSIEPAARRVT